MQWNRNSDCIQHNSTILQDMVTPSGQNCELHEKQQTLVHQTVTLMTVANSVASLEDNFLEQICFYFEKHTFKKLHYTINSQNQSKFVSILF